MMVEKVNILLVDDRPENLFAMESLLASPELNIVKAASGNEALGLMLEYDFALVLLDVQMPGMDGFETAGLMQGTEKTRHVPIIFVTAISTEQQHVFKGYESGAVDYLFKPIEPEFLKSKVRVFCELYRQKDIIRRQLREIEEKNVLLEKRLTEIQQLRGILPICSYCKKIRNDRGYWEMLEDYIEKHSVAEFSHGLCPDCAVKKYPQYFSNNDNDQENAPPSPEDEK
jgi:response regulator RpfG family c-di-GMP phosphodiesterase